jgi:4-(gamma-glutamylamino)butanal dehydrogenase
MTITTGISDWAGRAAELALDGRAIVDGARVAPASTLELRSARDGRPLTRIAACGEEEVDRAVAAALADQPGWARSHPRERGAALAAWADAVEDAREELALLIALEVGKPIRDALEVDLRGVVRAIRWYAGMADKLAGSHPDVGEDAAALVSREPVGVVAAVLPWNFPLAGVGYDVAPALAIGNAVVVKPSELASLSVLRCCELAVEAGVPPGALSVVPGTGLEAGAALGRHADVDAVSITGCARAYRGFLRYSAESNGKRVWPELGGKSTAIVCADAPDLQRVADAVAWGAYFNQGEMCTGVSRVLAHRSVHRELVAALAERIDELVVGDPLEWTTDVGAIVSEERAAETLDAIEEAVARGGRLVRGGEPVDVVGDGCYVTPALLDGVSPESRLIATEIFGPVTGVIPFDEVDEALRLAAAPGYGMGLSLWTASLADSFAVARAAKVGTVWVNCFEADDLTVPAGGVKRSGFGRTKSLAVLDKYSDLKTTWIALA